MPRNQVVGIVEPGLGDVEDRDRDPQPGARAAVRLADVGAPRLLEQLQLAGRIGSADLGELGADRAAAALEDAEDVAWRQDLPGRQRIELWARCRGRAIIAGVGIDRRRQLRRLRRRGV